MLTIDYFARLACSCGNTTEVPALIGYYHRTPTVLPEADLDHKRPEGWEGGSCPECKSSKDTKAS